MATSSTPLTSGQQQTCHTAAELVHLFSPFPFLISSTSQSINEGGSSSLPNARLLALKLKLLTLKNSPAHEHEITHIQTTLSKLSDKKLASQRFVPSEKKTENLSKLALGAKLDRALARRMGGQDAVMKVKSNKMDEKMNEKVAAN